jgi:predicted lipoprotein with Yx(FWY)xxD motif
MRFATILAAGMLLLAACTPRTGAESTAPTAGGTGVTVSHTTAGDALAGADGMTLYIFKADTAGKSTCYDACAEKWPAFLGDGSEVNAGAGISGEFGTTTRDDGSKQVTHGGQPLYYFADDVAAGDAKGEGFGGLWFIAPVDEASASPGDQPSGSAGDLPY